MERAAYSSDGGIGSRTHGGYRYPPVCVTDRCLRVDQGRERDGESGLYRLFFRAVSKPVAPSDGIVTVGRDGDL